MVNYGAGEEAEADMYNDLGMGAGMGAAAPSYSASAAPSYSAAAPAYSAPAAPAYSAPAAPAADISGNCPPGTIPGDLWGCKPSNNCPDGSPKPWTGICQKPCNYDEVKTFYGSCKKKDAWFGGKKSRTKKQNKRMYGGGGMHMRMPIRMNKHMPVRMHGGSAIPYSPNVWTAPGQYPSAVGGRRRKYSKTARKYKKHRKTTNKHKKYKKHSKITRKYRRK